MIWSERDATGRVRFAAPATAVVGYGGRAIDGAAYRPPGGHRFRDVAGELWWIIFQINPGPAGPGWQDHGDVLGCYESPDGGRVNVRVLAADVLRADADTAFRSMSPATYEDAERIAAHIPRPGK